MKFKGTKTQWLKSENSIGFVYALNEKKEKNVFSLNINNDSKVSDEEIKANALLISKAPEMLEMLKQCFYRLENSNHRDFPNKIKQLIKEATEL